VSFVPSTGVSFVPSTGVSFHVTGGGTSSTSSTSSTDTASVSALGLANALALIDRLRQAGINLPALTPPAGAGAGNDQLTQSVRAIQSDVASIKTTVTAMDARLKNLIEGTTPDQPPAKPGKPGKPGSSGLKPAADGPFQRVARESGISSVTSVPIQSEYDAAKALVSTIKANSDRLDRLEAANKQVSDSMKQLNDSIKQLNDGIKQIKDAVKIPAPKEETKPKEEIKPKDGIKPGPGN
jgi:X-X-X-Leu-X-X-Gly heptad repeat protein